MALKSEKLAMQIAEMQKQLEKARADQAEAADRELLDLVHKADCQREAIAFAEKKLAQKQSARASKRAVRSEPEDAQASA